MGYRWACLPDGVTPEVPGVGQEFPTRADAEAWLTETYPDLADAGVTDVTLYADDHVVYGPMSLSD